MQKIRLSDQIAERLETMIATQGLKAGDRLPAERQLAEQLEVSRPSLREALQKLTSKGLLVSRAGGGTYIQDITPRMQTDTLMSLFRENPEYRFDVLEIRHALEGNAAWYAALRATDTDKLRIQQCYETMLKLHGSIDPMDEARADAAFHLAMVEASHNLVLLHVMRSLFDLLQNSISHNLDKLYTQARVFESLSQQHRELMEAVLAGNPERARRAAENHLVFVEESLKTIDADEARKLRSLRHLSR